jgi:cell division transport system permease protein
MKTAWKHIRRSPYQALTAIFSMTLTFFVATILVVLSFSFSSLIHYYETRPQIIAYLKNNAEEDKVSSLARMLKEDPKVKDVQYVSREKAMAIYKEATAGNPLLTEFVSPSVFPASLEFSVTDISYAKELIEKLKAQPIVDEVAFTATLGDTQNINDVVSRLTNIVDYLRLGGGIIVGFLLLSSLLVLLVIVGMRISSRRDEIEILQLLGATPGFIRTPFLLEAIFYCVVGAFLGWLIALILTLYLSPYLVSFFQNVPFLPSNLIGLLSLFGMILAIEILVAILLGTLGSFLAIKRYLKI